MSSTDIHRSLVDSPIFAEIADTTIEDMCARGETISFSAGHVLFERAEDAQKLMILQEGIIELLFPVSILGATREVAMEGKRPGDVVAWSALVSPYHFTLSARCTSDCTVMSFTREVLATFFEADPATGYRFMSNLAGVIGRRLQAMQLIWMHDLQASLTR